MVINLPYSVLSFIQSGEPVAPSVTNRPHLQLLANINSLKSVLGVITGDVPAWSSTEEYSSGTYVNYNGETWVALQDNINSEPTALSEDWEVIDTSISGLQFNTTEERDPAEGEITWNVADGTLNVGLIGGNVSLQVGQEIVYRIRNTSGVALSDGMFVMANGQTGGTGRITCTKGLGDNSAIAQKMIGVVTEPIADGNEGFVTKFGYVRHINTTGSSVGETWAEGDILYIHPTIPGALTNQEPTGDFKMSVAVVVNLHASNGTIFVRVTNVNEVNDLDLGEL